MKRLIAFISILMLASVVSGTATSITIYGTNKSNADSNVTCYGCNNTIEVQAWNTSYVKNWTYATNNASDVVSFNISNVTGYQVQELKVNGTAVNAYQAGANGMLNFTYTQTTGNRTYVLAPASKISGYNFTWGWFWKNAIFMGNVGIGTTTEPNDVLDVAGYIRSSHVNPVLRFRETDETNKNWQVIGVGGNLVFESASDDFTTTNTRVQINNNGNVGIGTTSPATKLDVNGVISGNGSGLSNLNASNITIGTFIKTVTVNRSYVKDTVYQNTNSTAMFITVTAYASGSSPNGCNYKTGTANPPTDFVGSQAEANADMQSFWVLPQHYFAAFQSTGTCTITFWSVWQ